jgi:hypothetical protein
MTLFTWGIRTNSDDLSNRWALKIGDGFAGVIGQYSRDGSGWSDLHMAQYGLQLRSNWRWGVDHIYYDGPHCSLSLGWLMIVWAGDPRTGWCLKCCEEDEE